MLRLLFINPLTKKYRREMDSPVLLPGIRGLKITLVAGLALLTTDALFAQSAGQNDMDTLKTQMNQMQRQYEQRIEAMEAKMKTLESNANSGSILNTRVLTDADGKAAPTPMLDESFLKSLTRNFTFSVYIRSGVGFNGNGGPQDFSFKVPENVGGRWRLGNENDTYMELTWKQAHLLGDSPDVMDVAMTFTPRFSWDNTKTTSDSQRSPSTTISMRQAFVEAKNFIKSDPEITVWGGQRFYDRHDIHIHDYFFDDYSGYGLGFDNIPVGGFGKLLISYLGGIRDDLDNNNNSTPQTTVQDARRGGFYMHTVDARIHDIDLLGGKLELIGDYQFFKGGTYAISGGHPDMVIGDASGFRVGFVYQHPFGGYTPPPPPAPSYSKEGKPVVAPPPPTGPTIAPGFWQIAAFYGYGPGEIMGVDPNGGQSGNTGNGVSGGTPFAGYNFNINRGDIHTFPNGTQFVDSSVRHGTRIRANAQVVWNITQCFSIGATAYWEYDDQGFLSAQPTFVDTAGVQHFRTTGGSRNTVGAGFRPVFWVNDWFAIQGQAGWEYISRDRASSISTFQPGGPGNITVPTNDTFGRSGNMGIFTIAPTIKPLGGFFTRPEFRAFATYAIWNRSLEGSIATPQYQNNNQGWVFGVQTEWFF
jgi:maltoporin